MTNPSLRFKEDSQCNFRDWSPIKIKEIATKIIGGGTPSKANSEFWNGKIPWISSSDLRVNEINNINITRFITEDALTNSPAKLIPKNSILIVSRVGVGKVAIAPCQLCTSQDFTNLVEVKCDPVFLAFTLTKLMKKKSADTQGTSIKGITSKEIKEFLINLPCIEEQQKIASFFSTLDEKIQCTEKALNLTSKIFAYFLNRYIVDATQSNSCLFEEIASISSASRVHKKEWLNDGVPFFRSSDVVSKFKNQENSLGKAYISPELYKKLTKKSGELKKGDILVTGGGSVGIPYLIESDDPIYTKDADLLWIKPKSECINSKFLYYYIVSKAFRSELNKISHQGTISHLTISQLKKFLIPTPAISEQKRIVNNLDLFSLKLNILRKKLVLLESLKKGFMQQMFV